MYKKILSLSLVLLVGACNSSGDKTSQKNVSAESRIASSEYVVKFRNARTLQVLRGETALDGVGAVDIIDGHERYGLRKIKFKGENKTEQLEALMKRQDVEYVVKNFKLYRIGPALNTQDLREQWALTQVNAQRAWDLAGNKGSREVLVSVIDTGVDYNHESLSNNMVEGYDFKDNDADPMDDTGAQNPGHGTHCAGIIGADGQTEGGVSGIAPVVRMMPLRFLGANGSGDLMDGIRAIDHSIEHGADVISASWGASVSTAQAQPLIEAVQRASDAGVIFVAAAANNGDSNDQFGMYPANAKFVNTITVAASGPEDEKPEWSNFGKHKVDIAAPGLNIMSTLPNNGYDNLSGTSMATPLVAGLAALLKAQNPELTGSAARSIMQITGVEVDIETACNCRIDAGASMEFLLDEETFVAPHLASIDPDRTMQFALVNAAPGAVTFESEDENVATIDQNGLLTALAEGTTQISATDALGNTFESSAINVRITNEQVACPLGDPVICLLFCAIDPALPWCEL